MTERKPPRILACGCVLGWERCMACRPGLHLDQETALEITMREWAKQEVEVGCEIDRMTHKVTPAETAQKVPQDE